MFEHVLCRRRLSRFVRRHHHGRVAHRRLLVASWLNILNAPAQVSAVHARAIVRPRRRPFMVLRLGQSRVHFDRPEGH